MNEILNLETPKQEKKISIEPGFVVPDGFRESPLEYFEGHGINIKPGETEHKENGEVKEDPEAVKCLPVWYDRDGEMVKVVAKKINPRKGQAGKAGNPWHEVDVMKRVAEAGLPVAKLLAVAEESGEYLFVTERVAGFTVYDTDMLEEKFKTYRYTSEDIEVLKDQVKTEMEILKDKLKAKGIIREKWKLQDMVFEIDFEQKKVTQVTPVDWERTALVVEKEDDTLKNIPTERVKSVWESPESLLFYEWYEQQRVLPETEQSDAFREFLNLFALGQAELPKHFAHYRVRGLRDRLPS